MQVKKYSEIKEKVFFTTLENKMKVFFIPQKGFLDKMAIIATNFGSFHSALKGKDEDQSKIQIPQGIAHFLEPRMFSIKDQDATQFFVDLGANSNAFTSYDKTAYYFKTKDNFYENLKILLKMMSSFDSSEEQIENEKQIIIEELNMYKDEPFSKLLTTLYQNAYYMHPIKDDIGGTTQSVTQTTKKDLEFCFKNFYNPSHLTLVVAGDLDEKELITFLNKHLLKEKKELSLKKLSFLKEPIEIKKEKEMIYGNVTIPLFGMLYKLPPFNKKQDKQKELLKMEILMNYFFDVSGIYTESWLKKKIITSVMSYYHCSNIDLNCLILYNINENYDQTIEKIIEVFDTKHFQMTQEDFNRIKNKMIGLNLKNYGDGANVAKEYLIYQLDGLDYFKEIAKINEITISDIEETYLQICKSPYCIVVERSE